MTESSYVKNISAASYDLLRGKRSLLPKLDLELTERCNNRCIHCYINRPENDLEAQAREMDTDFILDLFRQAADLGCLTVRLTGGEPLLRPDFPEIYLAARKLGMRVALFTNARCFTPELVGLLRRTPPGQPVEISVYGLSTGSYDAVSGVRGSYDEFLRGIGLLTDAGIEFIVKGTLLPPNRAERTEFEEWAAEIPGMDGPPSYSMHFDLRARRDDPEKNRRIRALRITPDETHVLIERDPSTISSLAKFCSTFLGPSGDRLFSCGAGQAICIDSFGMAQMCLQLRHPQTVYDLKSGSLRDAIVNFFPGVRKVKASNPEYLRRCAVCFLKGLCEQCPAKSWMEHGTLDTPCDYLCDIAHVHARALGLVGEHEHAWEVTDWNVRVTRLSRTTERPSDNNQDK